MKPLTPAELTELTRAEGAIEKAERSFVDFGKNLAHIHSRKLYRPATWQQYVGARWEISDERARQLMDAAQAVKDLRHANKSCAPARESHVRPLLQVPTEDRVAVWQAAVKLAASAPRMTARHVELAVECHLGRPPDAAPGEVSETFRAALGSLTPDGKRQAIEAAETSAKKPAREHRRDDQDGRTRQVRRLLDRSLRLAKGLDNEDVEWCIERALEALDGTEIPQTWKEAA